MLIQSIATALYCDADTTWERTWLGSNVYYYSKQYQVVISFKTYLDRDDYTESALESLVSTLKCSTNWNDTLFGVSCERMHFYVNHSLFEPKHPGSLPDPEDCIMGPIAGSF